MAMSSDKGLVPVKVKGWVQGTVRRLPNCPRCHKQVIFDESKQAYFCPHCGLDHGIPKGRIRQQTAKHNLVTRDFFPMFWFNNTGLANNIVIFISNDDTGVDEMKTVIETTMNGTTNSGYLTAAKNTTSEYYTYTYVFTAPGSSRTIRQVGTGRYGYATTSNWKYQIVGTVTELSSPIEQTTIDTFEVVYKYQFYEVT